MGNVYEETSIIKRMWNITSGQPEGLIRIMILGLMILLGILLCSYYVTVILHEMGHLFFGILTGYQFLSFRIGGWMILKNHGIRICRQINRRSVGQCLLLPSEHSGNRYFLMVAGGIIFNLLFGVSFMVLSFQSLLPLVLDYFLFFLGVFNILAAVMNSIPEKKSLIENDGLCIKNMYKNNFAVQCTKQQMLMASELFQGKTYGEMKESLFYIDQSSDNLQDWMLDGATTGVKDQEPNLKNEIIASMYLYQYYRHIELFEYEKAYRKINLLSSQKEYLNSGLVADIEVEEYFLRCIQHPEPNVVRVRGLTGEKEDSLNPHNIRIRGAKDVFMRNVVHVEKAMKELRMLYQTDSYKGEVRFNEKVLRNLFAFQGGMKR